MYQCPAVVYWFYLFGLYRHGAPSVSLDDIVAELDRFHWSLDYPPTGGSCFGLDG